MRSPVLGSILMLAVAALSGCADPTTDTQPPTPPTQQSQQSSFVEIPVNDSGTLGGTAFACGPAGCAGQSTRPQPRFDLLANGTIRAIALTLTWEAASPATQQLRLGVSWNETGSHEFRVFDGTSPLSAELNDLAIRPDEEPYAWVFVPETGGAPAYVATEQDVTITGTLFSDA